MAQSENPLLGRKIFFLNPPLSIATYVVNNLQEMQYEVYSIENYAVAKGVLKKFPDSLCFIFIDDQLTLKEWYNFIKSFELDDDLKSIFLGVISSRIKPNDKEQFLMNLKLPGGFVMLGGPVGDVLKNIKGILDVNGAKGCRQYLRLDCTNLKNVSGYLPYNFRLYKFSLHNVSSAGFACMIDTRNGYHFMKKQVLDNICLNFNRKTVTCSALVYDVNKLGHYEVAVLLFTKDTEKDTRITIRNFVYECLNLQLKLLITEIPDDQTNYRDWARVQAAANGEDSYYEQFVSNEGDEILNNLGELEDLSEEAEEKAANLRAIVGDFEDVAADFFDTIDTIDSIEPAESDDSEVSDNSNESQNSDNPDDLYVEANTSE